MAGGMNETATIFAGVQAAVTELHKKLLQLCKKGSPLAGAKPEQVIARNGGLYLAEGGTDETYIEILARPAKAHSKWTSNPPPHGDNEVLHGFLWRALCEVRVNEDTGEIRVALAVFHGLWPCSQSQDCTNQLRGSIIMGIGMALTEEPCSTIANVASSFHQLPNTTSL